uniref:Vps53 C-terminal domain-containing protein n=1 Tax=Lygus hesperus TaxID=30085 RepID=A0A146MGZ4_LYGHE
MQEYVHGGFMNNSNNNSNNRNNNSTAISNETGEAMVQDESQLIRAVSRVLHSMLLTTSAVLPHTTLRFLLDKVAASFIPRYTNTLYKLRGVSMDEVGVLRMDSAALEKTFLSLPYYNDANRYQSTQLSNYMRLVRREFDQLNRALKVLQVDVYADTFMEVYYEVTLPENRSIQNFVRLVELKGRKREQVRP